MLLKAEITCMYCDKSIIKFNTTEELKIYKKNRLRLKFMFCSSKCLHEFIDKVKYY